MSDQRETVTQPTDLTTERLAELERIARAATPSPWRADPAWGLPWDVGGYLLDFEKRVTVARTRGDAPPRSCPQEDAEQACRDARHIAAFHPAVALALVAEVRTLHDRCRAADEERERLKVAIAEHHAQKADDRCVEDDDRLYAAAGLPFCDRRVGDKAAMLENCRRFIERRCEGGGWPSYAELEAEIRTLRVLNDSLAQRLTAASAEVPAWLKVLRPHLTNPPTCGCVYPQVCNERVVKAVKERLGVQS